MDKGRVSRLPGEASGRGAGGGGTQRHAAKSERYVRNMGARVTRGETKLILVKYENSANNNEPNHNRRGRGKS